MKKLLLVLTIFLFASCASVEDRIKEYSYTDFWYMYQNNRYQVYKTKQGRYYIIIVNKSETDLVRKYIKLKQ